MPTKSIKKTKFIFLSIIVLSCISLFIITYQKISTKKKKLENIKFTDSSAAIKNLNFFQTIKGSVYWKLNSQKAELIENESKAELYTVEGSFTTADATISFKADGATINIKTKNFIIKKIINPVSIETSSGFKLESDSLSWDNEKQSLTTEKPVKLNGNGITMTGKSALVNPKTGEMTFYNVDTKYKFQTSD